MLELLFHLLSWQINFMFLRIRLAVGHTDIFAELSMHRKLPLFRIRILGIGNKRHLGHFGNGNSREVVIKLNTAQKQITAATLKGVF